jgi:uncharacterized 2Fe-2S/4Fe-4S cluster protein (DUF4445 family)
VAAGTLLSEVLDRVGVSLNYPCGRNGTCGSCRVEFLSGAPKPSPAERELYSAEGLAAGERLGCQARIQSSAKIVIPGATRLVEPKILTSSARRDVPLNPLVVKALLDVKPSTVERPRADHELVEEVLHSAMAMQLRPTLHYLRQLPRELRAAGGTLTVTLSEDVILNAEAGNSLEDIYGVAVDIGSTTVAASLHSLRTGEGLAVRARLNPQVQHGEDVVSRLSYCYESPERLHQLHGSIIGCINALIEDLCRHAKVPGGSVYMLAFAGNAAMNHLFLGVPPEHIGLAPYTPVYRDTELCRAHDLGLNAHREARCFVMPNIGGFVGGDTVAGMIACDFLHLRRKRLFIDIGTNCEVVVAKGEEMVAASAPAGPAMEGGCISCGMRAEPGAIHDAHWKDGDLVFATIDDQPPRGLCGSGLFHVVHALHVAGAISYSGLFIRPSEVEDADTQRFMRNRLSLDGKGKPRLLLVPKSEGIDREVWLTQQDIREFQLAKAAISAAWLILCQELGIEAKEIADVYIAGAFGNYIRTEAALGLGLVPGLPRESLHSVGNTALQGARLALLHRTFIEEASLLVDRIRFVELAGRDDFQETFALELALASI